MLDVMKLNLGSKLMRKMVSKCIESVILKKTGYKIDINLDELEVEFIDGDAKVKTSLEVKLARQEFNKITKDLDIL